MIITHAINAKGESRIYIGAKSQLECCITPLNDGIGWTLDYQAAPTSREISEQQLRAWALERVLMLCSELNVSLDDLPDVPFHKIAALHTMPPLHNRRVGAPPLAPGQSTFIAHIPGTSIPQPKEPRRKQPRKPTR